MLLTPTFCSFSMKQYGAYIHTSIQKGSSNIYYAQCRLRGPPMEVFRAYGLV